MIEYYDITKTRILCRDSGGLYRVLYFPVMAPEDAENLAVEEYGIEPESIMDIKTVDCSFQRLIAPDDGKVEIPIPPGVMV